MADLRLSLVGIRTRPVERHEHETVAALRLRLALNYKLDVDIRDEHGHVLAGDAPAARAASVHVYFKYVVVNDRAPPHEAEAAASPRHGTEETSLPYDVLIRPVQRVPAHTSLALAVSTHRALVLRCEAMDWSTVHVHRIATPANDALGLASPPLRMCALADAAAAVQLVVVPPSPPEHPPPAPQPPPPRAEALAHGRRHLAARPGGRTKEVPRARDFVIDHEHAEIEALAARLVAQASTVRLVSSRSLPRPRADTLTERVLLAIAAVNESSRAEAKPIVGVRKFRDQVYVLETRTTGRRPTRSVYIKFTAELLYASQRPPVQTVQTDSSTPSVSP